MDYNYLAESLAALAGVPVRIYRDGRFLSLHHTRFKPDFAITEEENIFKIAGDVGYYMDPNFLYYGLFRIRGEDIALVIGPVSPSPVSRKLGQTGLGVPASIPMLSAWQIWHITVLLYAVTTQNLKIVFCGRKSSRRLQEKTATAAMHRKSLCSS